MDYQDEYDPKIKLDAYLDAANARITQRKEIFDMDLYKSSLLPTPV